MSINRTFGELKAAVLDISPPSNDVGRFLNEAQRKMMKETKRKRTVAVTVLAGVANVPAEALFVRGIAYNGYTLGVYPQENKPDMAYEGTPTHFLIQEGVIYLYPALPSGSIDVVICPAPVEMVLDTVYPTVTDADNALIAYGKFMVYSFNEDQGAADFWGKRWLSEAAEWVANDNKTIKSTKRVLSRPYV